MRTIALALAALLCLAQTARAGRLFHAFDFEERQLGNDEDVPMHWAKVAGPDLPHYVVGRLGTDRARSGRYSFRMDLDGGSCLYQYDTRRLPVTVGGHYTVSGYAATTAGLAHARARLTAAVVDADGRVLAEAASDPYAGDDWHRLVAAVAADDPRSAFLRVRMEFVQAARLGPPAPGAIVPDDIRGTAWFDDLAVAQTPRVSLSTDRPANVFRRDDTPSVAVRIGDPSADPLTAQLTVTDADGRAVFEHTGAVSPAADGRAVLPLPIGPAGWYRATVRLAVPGQDTGDDEPAATATLDYVQLADGGVTVTLDGRFAAATADVPAAAWPAVADVLPLIGVGRAKVSMADPAGCDDVLRRLADRGVGAVGCLPSADPDAAATAVARHGGHVDQWQLGTDDADERFVTDPAARRRAERASAAVAGLGGGLTLAVPCPVGFDPPAGMAAQAVFVPASILPGEIGPCLADRAAGGPAVASVAVRPVDAGRYAAADRAADLAKRIVAAMATGARRVDVPLPLAVLPSSPSTVEPTDLFLVERTVLTALAGTTCRGRLPIADGIEATLFERPDGDGVAVIWTDGDRDRPVNVSLGDRLTRTDLTGTTGPLSGGGLRAGPAPTIVTGVDVGLCRFRAGLAVDRPALEATTVRPQQRRVRITNPYAGPITGVVRLRGPVGWTLSPSLVPFTLAAGESVAADVGIDLPVNVRGGVNRVVAEVELHPPEGDVAHLSVPLAMTVGLSDVGVVSTAFRDGPDVIVQQRVTNYGDRRVQYTAYAACPGRPRAERTVVLDPGGSTVRRYRFAAVGSVTVRAGVQQADGARGVSEAIVVR